MREQCEKPVQWQERAERENVCRRDRNWVVGPGRTEKAEKEFEGLLRKACVV